MNGSSMNGILLPNGLSRMTAGSRDDILRTERLKSLCLVVLAMVFTYCMV
jgi:hypothetical protein